MKNGDIIKIIRAERPHTHSGFTSSTNVIAADAQIMEIRKITNTKNGRKCHCVNPGQTTGFAIYIDALPDFMRVEVVA